MPDELRHCRPLPVIPVGNIETDERVNIVSELSPSFTVMGTRMQNTMSTMAVEVSRQERELQQRVELLEAKIADLCAGRSVTLQDAEWRNRLLVLEREIARTNEVINSLTFEKRQLETRLMIEKDSRYRLGLLVGKLTKALYTGQPRSVCLPILNQLRDMDYNIGGDRWEE